MTTQMVKINSAGGVMSIKQTYTRGERRRFAPLFDPEAMLADTTRRKLRVWPEQADLDDWNGAIDHEYGRMGEDVADEPAEIERVLTFDEMMALIGA